MTRSRSILLVLGLYLLHQDVWFWRSATPVVFGVLPIGLFYHVAYTLATALVLWLLVRHHWPAHLDDEDAGFPRTAPKPGVVDA